MQTMQKRHYEKEKKNNQRTSEKFDRRHRKLQRQSFLFKETAKEKTSSLKRNEIEDIIISSQKKTLKSLS